MAGYPQEILSRWNTMIEGLQASPKEFYQSVEATLVEKQLKGITVRRTSHQEGGVFSANREYLRIERDHLIYDLCGAPFGNGFFISWWMGLNKSWFWEFIRSIPLIGRSVKPTTYYKVDTASMFQALVHSAVLDVIDDMTKERGLKTLADSERKPVMKEFFT